MVTCEECGKNVKHGVTVRDIEIGHEGEEREIPVCVPCYNAFQLGLV